MPVSYDLTVIFSLTPQSDVAYCVGLLQNLLRKSIDLQAYGSFSCFILCRLDCSRQATSEPALACAGPWATPSLPFFFPPLPLPLLPLPSPLSPLEVGLP